MGHSHTLPSLAVQAAVAFSLDVRITVPAQHVPPIARSAFSIAAARMAEKIARRGETPGLLPTRLSGRVHHRLKIFLGEGATQRR
jgi:hypothetical protein